MRILMVVRPATGGMKSQMMTLATGLVDGGHEVAVAGPGDSAVLSEAAEAGLPVHAVPIVGPLNPVRDARAVTSLARVLHAGGFHVVHAHGFKAGLVARAAAMLVDTPAVVVTVHNHVLYRPELSAATKRLHISLEHALAARCDRYIAVSGSVREELLDVYGVPAEKVVTVHNGVEPEPFLEWHDGASARADLDVPDGVPVLGCACRFAPQKGLDDLVGALAEIREMVPGTTLVLGGDGPLAGHLHEEAEAAGVSDAIIWPGRIPEDDVPGFLSALDAYVSSSLSEGLPLSLVEAAAAAVPTVATRVGGTPEIVSDGETGLLVEPGDRHALAEACARVLTDPGTARALGSAAREHVLAEFRPEAMVARTEEVYMEALTVKRR